MSNEEKKIDHCFLFFRVQVYFFSSSNSFYIYFLQLLDFRAMQITIINHVSTE